MQQLRKLVWAASPLLRRTKNLSRIAILEYTQGVHLRHVIKKGKRDTTSRSRYIIRTLFSKATNRLVIRYTLCGRYSSPSFLGMGLLPHTTSLCCSTLHNPQAVSTANPAAHPACHPLADLQIIQVGNQRITHVQEGATLHLVLY